MKRTIYIETISAILLLLFLYAGFIKLVQYDIFVFQVGESPFKLLAKSAHWIAWLIPVTEILVAFMLPFTKTRLYALYASAILMLAFTLYVGSMLLSGLPLPCACGGIISGLKWQGHLLFNIFFLILSVAGIFLERKKKGNAHKAFSFSTGYG